MNNIIYNDIRSRVGYKLVCGAEGREEKGKDCPNRRKATPTTPHAAACDVDIPTNRLCETNGFYA
jgi:hypothetical protein